MAMGKRRARSTADDVGGDDGPADVGQPSVLRAAESLLRDARVRRFRRGTCAPRSTPTTMGRPGLTPGIYFRLLLVGYFEGIDSERGIAWRAADSLALRDFLRLGLGRGAARSFDDLADAAADRSGDASGGVHVGAAATRRGRACSRARRSRLTRPRWKPTPRCGSIVRRDTGESYQAFLTRLAQASGIETPTREDLARLDRKRKKKTSNKDWTNPHDPDAKVTKMKDGRTHLAHKAEHAVDLDTGAIVAVTLQGADARRHDDDRRDGDRRGRADRRRAGRRRRAAAAGRDHRRQGLSQQSDDGRPRRRGRPLLRRGAGSRATRLVEQPEAQAPVYAQSSTDSRRTRAPADAATRRADRTLVRAPL